MPGAGDHQDVGFPAYVGGESGVGRRQLDDALCGGIEDFVSGGSLEIHRRERAVRIDRHGEPEVPVDSAPCALGIVEISDALDLLAPVLDIEGVANLGSARAHEGLARTLVVLLELACDLCFHPSNDQRAFGEPGSAACSTGSGDFARRSRSVSPPPSRLDWAWTSGRIGLERVLEFTNTTSSCDGVSLRRASGSLKWMESTIAWSTIEIDSAIASTRESGSSLASGSGHGHSRALETLNFPAPKSLENHVILGSLSRFVSGMSTAEPETSSQRRNTHLRSAPTRSISVTAISTPVPGASSGSDGTLT